jgi:hypothetical protein
MSIDPKSITDLRSGTEKRRRIREVQRSTFARFLGLFDFRLLQQYRPLAVMSKTGPDVPGRLETGPRHQQNGTDCHKENARPVRSDP